MTVLPSTAEVIKKNLKERYGQGMETSVVWEDDKLLVVCSVRIPASVVKENTEMIVFDITHFMMEEIPKRGRSSLFEESADKDQDGKGHVAGYGDDDDNDEGGVDTEDVEDDGLGVWDD